jgi:hypothetical protein
MSELLLQIIVEKLDEMGLLQQTTSNDADKRHLELMKQLVNKPGNLQPVTNRLSDADWVQIKQLFTELKSSIPPEQIQQSKPHYLRRKSTWIFVVLFFVFLAMAWGWGYTFRISTEYETDSVKYRYLKSISSPLLSRFCRQADSIYLSNPKALSDSVVVRLAGEKESGNRRTKGQSASVVRSP